MVDSNANYCFNRYLGEWGNLGECSELFDEDTGFAGFVSIKDHDGGIGFESQQENIYRTLELRWMLWMAGSRH